MKISYVDISRSPNKGLKTSVEENAIFEEGYTSRIGMQFSVAEIDLHDAETLEALFLGEYITAVGTFDGARGDKNWKGCNCLQVDVDGTIPAGDMLDKLNSMGLNYVLRYSRSHGTGRKGHGDRYHVFLPMDKWIDNLVDLKSCGAWVSQVLGGVDDSAKRASQVLFPGRADLGLKVRADGKDLSVDDVLSVGRVALLKRERADLLERAEGLREDVKNKVRGASGNDCHWLKPDMAVEVVGKGLKTLGWCLENWEAEAGTAGGDGYEIVCPICGYDEGIRAGNAGSANAMLCKNEQGIPISFCHSCLSRGLGMGGKGVYNFDKDDLAKFVEDLHGFYFFWDAVGSSLCYMYRSVDTGEISVRVGVGKDYATNKYKLVGSWLPNVIPEMELKLKFDSDLLIDRDRLVVNKYQAPRVLMVDPGESGAWKDCPYWVGRFILHLLGDDREMWEHFMKYLACIVQERVKLPVAFLIWGTQGTGKNLMFDEILCRIFGDDYCCTVDQRDLLTSFNAYILENVFLGIDELDVDFTEEGGDGPIEGLLKRYISDSKARSEDKFQRAKKIETYMNVIAFSNELAPLTIASDDRRWNVCERQEVALDHVDWLPEKGIPGLITKLRGEIAGFVAWLKAVEYDRDKLIRGLDNTARKRLVGMSKSTKQNFWEAIRDGDFDWFDFNVVSSSAKGGPDRCGILEILKDDLRYGIIQSNTISLLYNHTIGKGNRLVQRIANDVKREGERYGVLLGKSGRRMGYKLPHPINVTEDQYGIVDDL